MQDFCLLEINLRYSIPPLANFWQCHSKQIQNYPIKKVKGKDNLEANQEVSIESNEMLENQSLPS